ncbi:AraC family transcriptional regulator [Micromonospora sp. C28SCA-DRY-2]|uniref:AraC family transcriptional regulator n=1 Tax=Micromonospora sp. C28SCA-DRY-2 TaxID=3059522 RepID=UPI002675D2C6|nr:AraC family transcriptional regulator [Micromonospora sp. C28SCA-DRY-2]MDO3703279.1 AraC family transcriptional regulator [Micromonospora sp. C28SCA-DRY-2]
MRSSVALARHPDFRIDAVFCRDDHTDWSAPEPCPSYGLVLTRRGGFRLRGRGGEEFVDPTVAYLTVPGEEQRFAHPAGGDECTSLHLSSQLWWELFNGRAAPAVVHLDARIDLAHRLLLRAVTRPDPDFAIAERLVRLVGAAATPANGVSERDRSLVEAARAAVHDDAPEAAGLLPLARSLGVSPYRLSRSFHALVGVPLTRYRNRLRVGRALDLLTAGAEPARVAIDVGFADQAHLTRTVRAHVGHTPGQLRRLLRDG